MLGARGGWPLKSMHEKSVKKAEKPELAASSDQTFPWLWVVWAGEGTRGLATSGGMTGTGVYVLLYLNVFLVFGVLLRHVFSRLSKLIPYTVRSTPAQAPPD